MTKRFEVLNIIVFWEKNLHRFKKVGFIFRDYTENKMFGCSTDEAFEMITNEGCTNAEATLYTIEQHGYEGSSIHPLPHLNLPTYDNSSWHLPIYNEEFQPHVPYTEKLKGKIEQTIKNDIRWNYEVKKRKWKRENHEVYDHLFQEKMKSKYLQLAKFIKEAKNIVFLTGAGLGTESGIPDFRGNQSLYSDPKIMEKMTADYREEHPKEFFQFIKELLYTMMDDILPFQQVSTLRTAIELLRPNEGHLFMARLEKLEKNITIVTQNVDGLHEKAGSRNVFPIHGELSIFTCRHCGSSISLQQALELETPQCENCKGTYQPNIVLFGDDLQNFNEAKEQVANADLLIVVGTSLQVYPANMLPNLAVNAKKVIVNHKSTDLDSEFDLVIHGPATTVFGEVELQLGNSKSRSLCNVCRKNVAEGIYASRIAPTSSSYCQSCMDNGAEPYGDIVIKVALNKGRIDNYDMSPKMQKVLDATLSVTGKTKEEFELDVEKKKAEIESKR